MGNWEQHDRFINYVWETEINGRKRKQQVSIDRPILCEDRGNFRAAYDVVSSLDNERFLTNYYFVYEVARREVENWAQIINDTIDLEFSGIVVDSTNIELIRKDYFESLLTPTKLLFASGHTVDVWRFSPVIIDKRFELDIYDLFPRYYTQEAFARIEENNWIDVWMRKYLTNVC